VIDQAKGMIMMRERCDADAAFRKLVALSSKSNVKLRDVARRIVDSTVRN
jgi:AmiR/NasT family two-component response regulator